MVVQRNRSSADIRERLCEAETNLAPFRPEAFELDIDLIRGVEHQSIWMPTDPITLPHVATSLAMKRARSLFDTYTKHTYRTQ